MALPTPPVTSSVSPMDDNPASDKSYLMPGNCVNIFQPSFGLFTPNNTLHHLSQMQLLRCTC